MRARVTRSRAARSVAAALVVVLAACAPGADEPEPAVVRTGPPPWDAPVDAVSYLDLAGHEPLRFGHEVAQTVRARLTVVVDGAPVTVPANIGIDRRRAVESALHTHADDGVIWVESPRRGETFTLGDFFTLWGVRLDDRCLGDRCAAAGEPGPRLTVDGREHRGDPREAELLDGRELVLTAPDADGGRRTPRR